MALTAGSEAMESAAVPSAASDKRRDCCIRLAGLAGAKVAAGLPRWWGLKVSEVIARNNGYE